MNRHSGRGLLALGLLTLAGCGDSAESLLRAGMNQKSELTDRLMKVTDEPSAKKFIDHHMKLYGEKHKALNEKWEKWIKSIEDDYRGKIRVVGIISTAVPGTPQWKTDLLNAEHKKDDRILETRDAFIVYMEKITADVARFNREKARIADIVTHLVAEEKAKGENPNPQDLCPNLVKINERDTFNNILLTGSYRREIPAE